MEHNTGSQVTRGGKSGTKHQAKGQAFHLYQVYMCIKLNSNNIVITKECPCCHMEAIAPAARNAIRRAEQAVT